MKKRNLNMKQTKRFTCCLLSAAMAGTMLAGCGSSDKAADTSAAADDGPVQMEFLTS